MGITSFEGKMGTGKSLSATALAYTEWIRREMLRHALECVLKDQTWDEIIEGLTEKFKIGQKTAGAFVEKSLEIMREQGDEAFVSPRRIFSNNHLNFPYTHFDPAYFLEHAEDEDLRDCILILDEAYIYLDARTSAAKITKLFTYFIGQTRKRGVDLYVCTHHIDVLDKRLRRAIDVRGTCKFNPGPMEEEKAIKKRRYNWARITFRSMSTGAERRLRIYGPPFYGLYDTTEMVSYMRKQTEIEL